MLVRCLDFSGNEISAENLPTPLRLAVKRVELLKLPIFPNAWPKNPARDVSSGDTFKFNAGDLDITLT